MRPSRRTVTVTPEVLLVGDLPEPDEPMTTKNGELPPIGGSPTSRLTAIPSNLSVQRQAAKVRRSLEDIPVDTKELNAVSIIAAYTLIGLSDSDIGIATGLSPEQITRIKDSEGYSYVYEAAVEAAIDSDAEGVRHIISTHSRNAVEEIARLSTGSEMDSVRLRASQDLLDRAGHRPVDVVAHQHTLEGELTIRHVKARNDGDLSIDLDVEDVEHD